MTIPTLFDTLYYTLPTLYVYVAIGYSVAVLNPYNISRREWDNLFSLALHFNIMNYILIY